MMAVELDEHIDHFFGIYRGVVVAVDDPEHRQRLRVKVPQVHGSDVFWAMPAQPVGATALPDPGAGVWVQFEAGDPDHPVWTGIFHSGVQPVTTHDGGTGATEAAGTFMWTQNDPSMTWVIVHDLGYHPSITVVDSGGTVIEGDAHYPNVNTVVVNFTLPFGGVAYLS